MLKLVVEGHTSKEIAALVNVSPSSVDSYRARVMHKLDAPNLAALVRLAIRYGLIAP